MINVIAAVVVVVVVVARFKLATTALISDNHINHSQALSKRRGRVQRLAVTLRYLFIMRSTEPAKK